MRTKQLPMIKKMKSDYGGSLRNTRKGRAHSRPISTKHTMHLVLRSTKATGEWNFRRPKHDKNIRRIIEKFSFVYGIKILSIANAWNHLHLQIKLSNRFTYTAFIRAITGAIAMSITGRSRWTTLKAKKEKFWDHRPFTRIVESMRAFVNLTDYIRMNQIESEGFKRDEARSMVQVEKVFL